MAFHFLISKRGFAFFEGPADAAAAPDASTIAVSAILRFLARENEWDVESSWKNQNFGLGVYPEFFERGFGVEKKIEKTSDVLVGLCTIVRFCSAASCYRSTATDVGVGVWLCGCVRLFPFSIVLVS